MNSILFELADVYMPVLEKKIDIENIELLLGQICFNRITGIAYQNFLHNADKLSLPRAAMKILDVLYQKDLQKSQIYHKHLKYLCNVLENVDFKYALLKGAFLNTVIYEAGMRTSNDIDILISEKDITKCQYLLKENGFVQGDYITNKGIVEATRKEIIMSKMNYGETVPFVKLVEGEPLVIDLNFSIDFKPELDNSIVKNLLLYTQEITYQDCKFFMLSAEDFMIHLCCHLYKEATTYDWVRRRNDLMLYKFSDLNVMIHKTFDSILTKKLADRIHKLGLQKECYYALYNTGEIYHRVKENTAYQSLLEHIKPQNLDFMQQIFDPVENKTYKYSQNFVEWFELPDRLSVLK